MMVPRPVLTYLRFGYTLANNRQTKRRAIGLYYGGSVFYSRFLNWVRWACSDLVRSQIEGQVLGGVTVGSGAAALIGQAQDTDLRQKQWFWRV